MGNQAPIKQQNQMRKTNYEKEQFKVGCYVDESAGSADDCNSRTISFARAYGFKPGRLPSAKSDDYSEELSWLGDQAVEFLNGLETRSHLYWGFEDNSLFLMPSVENAKEDCGFVSGQDGKNEPDQDYQGEWLSVSDHGNCTLYVRENGVDREIWSVV